jgi:methylase of polypeptide subunit release factors
MTTTYYKLTPEKIFEDIIQSDESTKVRIKGREFFVHPHVYPSDKFRTTNFLLDSIQPLLKDAVICDMGCGMGIIGLFALQQGAKRVVQADINPLAVENAKANIAFYHYPDRKIQVFESNCFDNVPKQVFDVIVFNVPFHNEPHDIEDPLEYAFHDPNFVSTKKFLHQSVDYCHQNTDILIAFSNKGDVHGLEEIFDGSDFKWELWRKTNTDQEHDNRIYRLCVTANLKKRRSSLVRPI